MEKKSVEKKSVEKIRGETKERGEHASRYGLAKHLDDTEEHGQDFISTEMEKRSGDPQRKDMIWKCTEGTSSEQKWKGQEATRSEWIRKRPEGIGLDNR